MGFEPTEHFCSTAFKAVALTQTLPTLRVGAEVRLELTLYWLMRPVSLPLDYSAMVSVRQTVRGSLPFNGKHSLPPKALCVKCDGMNGGEDLTGFEPVNKQFLAARSPSELKVHVSRWENSVRPFSL